jgi:hypothetical protein
MIICACDQPCDQVKLPLQGGASRILIILFRYLPHDPAYKAVLARHETGQRGRMTLTMACMLLKRVFKHYYFVPPVAKRQHGNRHAGLPLDKLNIISRCPG